MNKSAAVPDRSDERAAIPIVAGERSAIPKRADERASRRAAYDFALAHDISYPLDPFILFKGDRVILPWSEACRLNGDADYAGLRAKKADAGTRVMRGSNEYLTVYDDGVTYRPRLRFTAAHEFGHIEMGHLVKYETTAVNKGGLGARAYKVLETEADFYAGELMSPVPLLILMGLTSWDDVKNIQRIFNISLKSARRRHADIAAGDTCGLWEEYIPKFEKAYKNRLKYFTDGLACTACGFIVADAAKPVFCPACGGRNLRKVNDLSANERADRRYTTIPIGTEGRPRLCPVCGDMKDECNEGFFCAICGTPQANVCVNNGCGGIRGVNDRYCAACGSETYYHANKLNKRKLTRRDVRVYPVFRLANCPVCGNKKIKRGDTVCGDCGAPLYNVCGNCKTYLAGNARCCHICGAVSSFRAEGFIEEWDCVKFNKL